MSFADDVANIGRKRTRRGKRSRGHGPRLVASPAVVEHHAALNEAMEVGDHPAAKSSALAMAKALHALTKKAAPITEPSMIGGNA